MHHTGFLCVLCSIVSVELKRGFCLVNWIFIFFFLCIKWAEASGLNSSIKYVVDGFSIYNVRACLFWGF